MPPRAMLPGVPAWACVNKYGRIVSSTVRERKKQLEPIAYAKDYRIRRVRVIRETHWPRTK